MIYVNAIMDNIDHVRSQIDKYVSFPVNGASIACAFPDIALRTASGNEFRIVGTAVIPGNMPTTFYLGLELLPRSNSGNVFVISQRGRFQRPGVSDMEKEIVWMFKTLASQYQKQYGVMPVFMRYLSEEQMKY